MHKSTIELKRVQQFPRGWSPTTGVTENEVLDAIVEWLRTNNYKIYKHLIRYAYENEGKEYAFTDNNDRPPTVECDYVTYLDIYYQ